MEDEKKAKQIFDQFDGSYFLMCREGVFEEYKSYMIPRSTELQWLKEKQDNVLKNLLKCTNNKTKAELFDRYGQYASYINDAAAFRFMLSYLEEHKSEWDTETLFRIVSTILNARHIERNRHKEVETIKRCVEILGEELKTGIKISDDYKINGEFPDYISEERLHSQIRKSIEYWSKEIMKKERRKKRFGYFHLSSD